jgi:hypothetical protein
MMPPITKRIRAGVIGLGLVASWFAASSIPRTARPAAAGSIREIPENITQPPAGEPVLHPPADAPSSAAGHAPGTDSVEALARSILLRISGMSPKAAAHWMATAELGEERQLVLNTLAQRWADQDSLAELRWAVELPDPEEYRAALATGCTFHAEKDAALAVKLATEAQLDDGTMSALMQQWAGQDIVRAQAWLEGQPAGSKRDLMTARLVNLLAQHQPATAASVVARQMSAGPLQDETVLCVLHHWARRDLPAARHWVDLFPPGPARQNALAALSSSQNR